MRAAYLTGILVMSILGCSPPKQTGKDLMQVSVSILPQKYFVERLAGEQVSVNVMIPPGASPATYEPTVSQLTSLEGSALYLSMGYLGFERSWMEKLRSVNKNMKVLDLSTTLEMIRDPEEMQDDPEHHHGQDEHAHAHGGPDPHTWMSPLNVKLMSRQIHAALCELLPESRQEFDSKLNDFLAEIDSLDSQITRMLSPLHQRTFMIYHPALAYLARDHDLKQLSLEFEGKEPSPQHMKMMVDLGRSMEIRTIFIQKEFDRRNASVLAKEIGAQLTEINPLDPDWPSQLLHISNTLHRLDQ